MMLRQLLAQTFPTACSTTSSSSTPTTNITTSPPPPSSTTHGVIISGGSGGAEEGDQEQHPQDLEMSVSPGADTDKLISNAKVVSESPEFAVLSKMQPSFGPSANSAFHTLAAAAAAATAPNNLFDIGEYQQPQHSTYYQQQQQQQQQQQPMMYGGQADVTNYLNGSTSDLFSSTYAVLASDSVAGFPQLAPTLAEWPCYAFDSSAHAISIAAAERLHGCSMEQQQPTTAYLISSTAGGNNQQFGVPQPAFQSCHPGQIPGGQSLLNPSALSSPLLQYHPSALPQLHPAQFQHTNGSNSTIQSQQQVSLGVQSPANSYHMQPSVRVQDNASPSPPNLNSQSGAVLENGQTPLSSRRFSCSSIKTEEDTWKRPAAECATQDVSEQKSSSKHRFARDLLEGGKKKATGQPPSAKRHSSQSVFTEAFRKITSQVPVDMICGAAVVRPSSSNGDASSGEEDDVKEKVMCLACKGVYPSRRSLTGHIGRNEKCREVIGRNYLDQLAQLTSQDIIPDLSASDGVSPVCPHCDRFISHYKGNIRRHINQCKKGKESSSNEQKEEGSSTENEVGGGNCNSSPPSSFSNAPPEGGASSVDLPSISSSTCSSTSSSITPNNNSQQHTMNQQHHHQQHQHVVLSQHQQQAPLQHHMPMSAAAPLNIIHHHQTGTVYLQRPFEHAGHIQHPPLQNGGYVQPPPNVLPYANYEQHNGMNYSNGVHPQQQMVVSRSGGGHMDGEDEDQYQPNGGHLLFGSQQHQSPMPQHTHPNNFKKEVYRTVPAQSLGSPLNLSSPLANQTIAQSKSHHKKSDAASSGQTCSDPYSCVWCTFSTAYKGNMKRHLISCHAVNDELLRKYSFDVDRLRQSAINRPAIDELPIVPRETTQSVSSNRSQSGRSPTQRNGSNGSNSQRNKRMLEPQPTTASGAIRGRPRKNSKLAKDTDKGIDIKLEQDNDEAGEETRPTSKPQESQQPRIVYQPVHQDSVEAASAYSPQPQLFVIMNNGSYDTSGAPPQHIGSHPSTYNQPQFQMPNGAFKPLLSAASKENFEGSNDSGISVQSFINTNSANL